MSRGREPDLVIVDERMQATSSPTYERLVAKALKATPERSATLWSLECSIRRERGRVDYPKLSMALDAMIDSGRIEREADVCTGTVVYRMAKGRR